MISQKHLRETVSMNRKHMQDHQRMASSTSNKASEKYHEAHAKEHKKMMKADLKAMKKRSGS